jgi:hypothetical protein
VADKGETRSGVAFRDGVVVWRDLGRQYGGDITAEFVMPMRADSGVLFHVRVLFRPRVLGTRSTRGQSMVSAAWPNGSSSTIAGLLFRLSFDLGSKLEQQEPIDPASEQTRFA